MNNIRDREMESFNTRRTALIDNVRGGQIDMIAALQQMLTQYGNASDEARKEARRARIRRQYEQWGYSGWRPESGNLEEEDRINKALKERIFFASACSFSDEEGGDGDEGEDEDGEWEDEEGEEEGKEEENEEGGVNGDVDADINTVVVSG